MQHQALNRTATQMEAPVEYINNTQQVQHLEHTRYGTNGPLRQTYLKDVHSILIVSMEDSTDITHSFPNTIHNLPSLENHLQVIGLESMATDQKLPVSKVSILE
jgi:hypothetical protein